MKHLVIIGMVVPEPASTAAGHRMLQLLEMFRSWDYQITFLTSAQPSDFSSTMDVETIQMNDSSFDERIKELAPDVVLFDRYVTEEQFGWRVSENCPNVIRILDTEDLHFLRTARQIAFKENRELEYSDYINTVFKRELASILRCDLSLIISQYEYQLLTETFQIAPQNLLYIPFLNREVIPSTIGFSERKNFMSIGNFLHEPNWQTVLKLKSLWKSIRKQLSDAEMHIYGAYASEKVFQLHNDKEGFLIKGRAENVTDVFNSTRVLLAPIPFGAGLKGKLWESMLYGLPNVTTEVGAEGMQWNGLWNGFVVNSDEDFTEKAVQLYTSESDWNQAQENGYEIAKKQFDWETFETQFEEKVDSLFEDLQKHRQANFLGQILQHHSLNSTKFMSKWIEAKNKK